MSELVDVQNLDNIEKYIANAAILKNELPKILDVKEKFARLTYLFPSFEDKMICKAIFDTMYISEVKIRKFITRMVDGLYSLMPQNVSQMIDIYNQTSVVVNERLKKQEKESSDTNGEHDLVEEKQGTSDLEDKQSQKADAFSVAGGGVFNIEIDREKKDKNSTSKTNIIPVSKSEIETIKNLDEQKQIAKKQLEDEKRRAYEDSLRERRQKRQVSSAAVVLEQMRSKYDD